MESVENSSNVRMAMAVPAETNYDLYNQPLMRFFLQNFGKIMVLVFRKQIFPDLEQDTYYLLAQNYGETCSQFAISMADGTYSLEDYDLDYAGILPEQLLMSMALLPGQTS